MSTPMTTTVTDLHVERVDLVDVGASLAKGSDEGAHVLLYKRAASGAQKGVREASMEGQSVKPEATTFDDAMLHRKMSEIYTDLSDHIGALMEAVESTIMSDAEDKPALLKTAIAAFSDAVTDRVAAWVGTVTKEGRKISDARLKKLKEMWNALDAVIAEAEGRSQTRAAKGANMQRSEWPEEIRAHVEAVEKQLADTEAALVAARAEQSKESEEEAALKSLPESLRKRIEAAEQRAEESERIAKSERDERLKVGYLSKAAAFKGLPIKADDDWSVLKAIDERLEKAQAERVMTLLKAADEAMVAAKMFSEHGTSGADTGNGAYAQIDTLARELVTKSAQPLTIEQARVQIMEQRPDLYRQAREEGGQH